MGAVETNPEAITDARDDIAGVCSVGMVPESSLPGLMVEWGSHRPKVGISGLVQTTAKVEGQEVCRVLVQARPCVGVSDSEQSTTVHQCIPMHTTPPCYRGEPEAGNKM